MILRVTSLDTQSQIRVKNLKYDRSKTFNKNLERYIISTQDRI